MDSKIVSKYIRNLVWSSLKPLGFTHIKGRTAWRVWSHGVDTVNFQSFNSYLAEGVGCTTYSFAVNLGIHFDYIADLLGKRNYVSMDGLLLPHEYDCSFRRPLQKTRPQPELARTGIWFVRADGANAEEMVQDARDVIQAQGLPWFERFHSPQEVLRTLQEDSETDDGTWGFGSNPSPIRTYMLGYVSKQLGDTQTAARHFRWVLESEKMPYVHERLRAELAELS